MITLNSLPRDAKVVKLDPASVGSYTVSWERLLSRHETIADHLFSVKAMRPGIPPLTINSTFRLTPYTRIHLSANDPSQLEQNFLVEIQIQTNQGNQHSWAFVVRVEKQFIPKDPGDCGCD